MTTKKALVIINIRRHYDTRRSSSIRNIFNVSASYGSINNWGENKKMDENEIRNEATEATENIGVDYLSQIEQLKKNSVPRAEYDKLRAEQERMLKILQEGGQINIESSEPDMPSVEQLRNELFTEDCDLTNLEFCEKSLQLRKQILEKTGEDIFVASNQHLTPTQFDYDRAKAVASVMQECIDYAQGDSEAFTNELMRRTNDVSPTYRGR